MIQTRHHMFLSQQDVYYLALVRVTPASGGDLFRWMPIVPVTGAVYRLTAFLTALLRWGVIDLAYDVAGAVKAARLCFGAYLAFCWQKFRGKRLVSIQYKTVMAGILVKSLLWGLKPV